MKTIIVVGIPGSGKSSILAETVRQVPSVRLVNVGETILAMAAENGLTRDQLRKMPVEEQLKSSRRAMERIREQGRGVTLIDTHAMIWDGAVFIPGITKEIAETLAPKVLAWVECDPHSIVERRKLDSARARDQQSEEQLKTHQELTRNLLTACSMWCGAALCRIVNQSADLSRNALPLVKIVQALL